MSSSVSSHRKKKKNITKTSSILQSAGSKPAKKKQKTRLTRQYKEKEKEVQELLQVLNLNVGANNTKENDFDTKSIEFFCNESHTFATIKAEETEQEHSSSSSSSSTAEPSDDSERSKATPGRLMSPRSVKEINHQASSSSSSSSIIQIENGQRDLFTHIPGAGTHIHKFSLEFLYTPKDIINPNIRLENSSESLSKMNSNSKLMLHRYYEETKSKDEKLSRGIIDALLRCKENNSFFRMMDKTLYRSFCLHKFHPIFCDPMPDPVEIPIRQFVKLYLKELRFTKHPNLCEEHTLANELEDMYEEYADREQKRIDENLEKTLHLERNVVSALMKRISGDDDDDDNDRHHLSILEEHLFKIKELRQRLYQEQAFQKNLLKSILDKWLQLKKLRHSQEFQCTRLKLCIQVQELNSQTIQRARKVWAKRFQTDLSELYREELEIYYSSKRLWEEAKKNAATQPTTSFIIKPPKKPNLSHLSAELKEKYAESFYMPEEPRIDIKRSRTSDEEFYENTRNILNNNNNNNKGATSQQNKLRSYFLKIYFDNEFVAESRSYRLEPDLSIGINEAIGIFIEHRLPKQINIALYEKSKISTPHKIAKIVATLPQLLSPPPNSFNISSSILSIEFISKKESIAGRLYLGFKCHKEPTSDAENMLSLPHLSKPIENFQTTDDDDDDDDGDSEEKTNQEENYQDTCTFEESLVQFCSLDDLKGNARFNLLRSRYLKNNERTRDLRFVPALENELEFDCDSDDDDAVLETGNWMDPIDLHKHAGKKFLKTLYEAIRIQCSRLDKAIASTENLLIGDEPAVWRWILNVFTSVFNPGRALHSVENDIMRNEHGPILQWMDGQQSFNINMFVLRATGVPVRAHKESSSANDDDGAGGGRRSFSDSSSMFITQNSKYSNVRPFIALSYKDKFCRTLTAEGSNPIWNEQLVLHLNGSLAELRDDLKIIIFDEIVESHVNDDLAFNMNVFSRIQTNYLGEYRIPISTILQRRKFQDNVELNVPKILLGYKRPSMDVISTSTSLDTNIVVENRQQSVQLLFYLNIEPIFDLPRINTKTLECSELREVRQQLYEWGLMVREMQPSRFIEPLVCTDIGKRVCITRLLEPIPLPFDSSNENIFDSICRYVSLLSLMKSHDACSGHCGIWLNNQVFLDTTWGTAKDFGVLLCNFLLSLGLKCWLILGHSNTYSEAAFVLYKSEDNELNILEPCSGKRYLVKDVLSPLYSINYVVSQDNIFCNIQPETRLSLMNFNFNDTSFWLPAFSRRNPAPLGGVQNLNYSFYDSLNSIELMKNIERKIVKKINSWRSLRKTVWNRAFQSRLYSSLLELESQSTFKDSNVVNAEQIAAEYPAYKLYGFTLNFSYTNLSAISERVRSTGIHLNSNKNVEFCVAVHVNKYPNNVLSVWIFLSTVLPAFERLN